MNPDNRYFSKLKLFLITIFGAGFLIFFLILFFTYLGIFGPVPSNSELQNIKNEQATVVLSSDGKQLGTYHSQNRTSVHLEEINPLLIDALLAIEDIRFFEHNGIDNRALVRVFVRSILLRQNAGGGSTITQQLAKNLFPRKNNGGPFILTDKLREMIIARRIETLYSKEEILELYLNTVSFGEDTFGIEMASYRFFNKPPSDLNLNESATLAGVLKATTFYNPHRNPERSIIRRNVVLRQMKLYGLIPSELADEVSSEPLLTDYNRTSLSDSSAPYFREHLRNEIQIILQTQPSLDGHSYNLNTDGLTIHTTLDSRVQQAAEQAVASRMEILQDIFDNELRDSPIFGMDDPDVLKVWERSDLYSQLILDGASEEEINKILHTPAPSQLFTWDGYEERDISPYDEIRHYLSFLSAGFIAIEPKTGHVIAWVGGIDHRHFQFDQIKASRQPGSAFKPILYSAAMQNGWEPCDYQRNMLATFTSYDDWTPRNNQDEYGGRYSLQAAMAQSVNTVAVQLGVEIGASAIQETAKSLGIHSPIPESPSIALGTANLSLLELTTAYTAFLNEGKPASPQFITQIYNSENELIYDFTESDQHKSLVTFPSTGTVEHMIQAPDTVKGISPDVASAMVSMLQKTVDEGTGQSLRSQFGIQHALGGKTGTTQQYTDGWFVGFTPDLVFGTRVGGANNRVRFQNYPAYASQTALPIAGEFLSLLSNDQTLPAQRNAFHSDQIDTPFSTQCQDYRNDKLGDRVRDFFTGRSSDEAREINPEKEKERGNIFKRIGKKLGIH